MNEDLLPATECHSCLPVIFNLGAVFIWIQQKTTQQAFFVDMSHLRHYFFIKVNKPMQSMKQKCLGCLQLCKKVLFFLGQ